MTDENEAPPERLADALIRGRRMWIAWPNTPLPELDEEPGAEWLLVRDDLELPDSYERPTGAAQ